MNIFYLEWNSFCNEDMFEILKEMGHNVITLPFSGINVSESEIKGSLEKKLATANCDFVFSFNYFPAVSNCCKELEIKYVSWVYDSPYIHVYSYTVLNPCNYIFLFDYVMYEELRSGGIDRVYYLPLAVNERRLSRLYNSGKKKERYSADISFVGSLYSEKRHRIYDKFQNVNRYAKGYLDGMIQAQLRVHGCNFLQELLTSDIVEEMQKVYPTDPNASTVLTPEAIYADYVLARQVTALERTEILSMLGESYPVDLYTYDKEVKIPGICNKGLADYYDDMPYVFMNSKINLNITLRSIKTGIPLRAMDIMGSGGFLLTNYQAELFQYFEANKDFVYYSDNDDLLDKVAYYLKHDEERETIARRGCEKVRTSHTLRKRIEQILEVLTGGNHENTAL